MPPLQILTLVLLVLLFTMSIVNSRRITSIESPKNISVVRSSPSGESMTLRSRAGVVMPKSLYYVRLAPGSNAAEDQNGEHEIVRINKDDATDYLRLKADIDNHRIKFVFRLDRRREKSLPPNFKAMDGVGFISFKVEKTSDDHPLVLDTDYPRSAQSDPVYITIAGLPESSIIG